MHEVALAKQPTSHFVNRSEYISTSCLARSIGLGPEGGSGSEFPNQLIVDRVFARRKGDWSCVGDRKPGLSCSCLSLERGAVRWWGVYGRRRNGTEACGFCKYRELVLSCLSAFFAGKGTSPMSKVSRHGTAVLGCVCGEWREEGDTRTRTWQVITAAEAKETEGSKTSRGRKSRGL